MPVSREDFKVEVRYEGDSVFIATIKHADGKPSQDLEVSLARVINQLFIGGALILPMPDDYQKQAGEFAFRRGVELTEGGQTEESACSGYENLLAARLTSA